MAISSLPRGLITDLITPLEKGGGIDGRSLGRHLRRVLPHTQALFLAGPRAGEGRNLNALQREELLRKTLEVVRGKVAVLVWITDETPDAAREILLLLEKALERSGYAGQVFWVDTPLYYQSNRGLPRYYQDMAAPARQPWVLHNDPDLVGQMARAFKRNNIRTSIFKVLSRIENLQGLISSGSLDRDRNYQKAVRSRAGFRIFDGEESRFLSHPSLSGVLSVGANIAPKAWAKITASSLNLGGNGHEYPDRLQQIWETGEYLSALIKVYRRDPVPLIKQVLFELGIIESSATTLPAENIAEKAGLLKELIRRPRPHGV